MVIGGGKGGSMKSGPPKSGWSTGSRVAGGATTRARRGFGGVAAGGGDAAGLTGVGSAATAGGGAPGAGVGIGATAGN